MKKGIKNFGKSIRAKLLNVSKSEGVFYQIILTRYFQERLLYRLSLSPYRNNFYLKGGALMYVYEHFAARPTLDIDFLGNNISNEGERIAKAFQDICSVPCDEDVVVFSVQNITFRNITEFKEYHGVHLNIPVLMDTISQDISMDIGFGDIITPQPIELDYPLLLDNLPEVNILAYSIETVIAEKMHAVIDLADNSSRMKDYYDLYTIIDSVPFDEKILGDAVRQTFSNRHTEYSENTLFFKPDLKENKTLNIRWQAFIRKIKSDSELKFPEVVTYLQSRLKPYWEILK